ncbi:MAG: hypothetical protein HOI95_03840, partial [Chromatiales bacterium]|nr:hypothetical protein [Chromatiales bacterium]
MGRYVRRARLWSGLVLAAFVLTHFANHIVAIHSLGAAESVRAVFASLWHFVPLQFALYTAIAAHFLCALYSLYIRRTLRMPAWEAAQVALGLLVVPLIALHVVGTRGLSSEFGVSAHYARTAAAIWATDTGVVRQFLLVAVVWLHLCYGIHFWLRLKTWYGAWQAPLFALAIVYPTLTMVGFLRAGLELDSWKAADIEALFLKMEAPVDVVVAFAARGEIAVFTLFALSLALVGVARGLR